MIEAAIHQIASQLNQHLKRSLDLPEDIVEVSNLLEQDGTVTPHINNKLVAFLVNIEKDTSPLRRPAGRDPVGSPTAVTYPPVHLNLHVMVAAHFAGRNYREALKFISATIAHFQGNPVIDHSNTPGLDPGIQRLTVEIENLSIQDLSNLWSVLSGKYLPSILYKVRMITVDSGDLVGITPAVRRPQPSVAG